MPTRVLGSLVMVVASAGVRSPARGDEGELREQVKVLTQRLEVQEAKLAAATGEKWFNERRAEEIKTLIHEVLADADTRASLAEGGLNAGYNKGFFVSDDEGKHLLK